MKNVIMIMLLLGGVSCSLSNGVESELKAPKNTKEENVNIDLVSTDMASVNYRIRAKLIRKENYKSFDHFDLITYRLKVSENKDASEIEYLDYLGREDTEVIVKGHMRNFVVCTKNAVFKFTICDSSNSVMVDFVSTDMTINLEKKADSLLTEIK